ncbi:1-phosphofructokinase [Halomicroarcula sp. GCM10025324]|uniref:1-phosphofructokinase n=1 Tax=Haloarcula TaxID=2237 RepID=UPI0023E8F9D4|nr:1-phosphofructokinase [Halomicroarcula sp. ZS-22-S1]
MIVTVTYNPAVDQTLQFDEPMDADAILRATDARFNAGGKGINVARYLTGLDRPCVATGIVGGFTGEFISDELEDDGIETDFVQVDGPTRLNTTAIAAGEEYKLNHDSAPVEPESIDELVETVQSLGPERVLVSGSLPPGVSTADVDRIARAGDWDTVVDMGGTYLTQLESEYALCKPNREELAEATGTDVSTVDGCARAADAFRDEGFDRVLASMGADGAVLATGSELLYAEALDVDVVDTVGAGDSLLSGAVAAWDEGADDRTALRTGVAVSSRLVQAAGTDVNSFDGVEAARDRVTVRRLDE